MVGGEKEEHNRAMGEYDQTYCNHLSLCSCCSGDQLPSPVTQRRAPAPTNGDYEQEKKLVAEITAPGGVKAAPPRDMLASFITRSGIDIGQKVLYTCTMCGIQNVRPENVF